ncbi:MAG: ATP-grasp domain-containing protein, partial [Candidatus Undinarchaeales archaeon]|nr:ATP-grasp domain-containing protein [Candidatus Undinarchaeales archaeon]
MPTVLVLCFDSHVRLIREFFERDTTYDAVIDPQSAIERDGVGAYVERIAEKIRSGRLSVDGIATTTEDLALVASVIAREAGLAGPAPGAVFACQNKLVQRTLQRECAPEATPDFFLARDWLVGEVPGVQFPLFVKPVTSALSFYSHHVEDAGELRRIIREGRDIVPSGNRLNSEVIELGYIDHPWAPLHSELLCEGVITGTQVTVDGYVREGGVVLLGTTLSVFVPGTISFSRFDFPHQFDPEIDSRVAGLVQRVVTHIGLDDTLFNMELMVDGGTGAISIVELNTRLSFQFVPLIEWVRGVSPLRIMCDIAVGREPKRLATEGAGPYSMSSSCVLRTPEDRWVVDVPSSEDVARI